MLTANTVGSANKAPFLLLLSAYFSFKRLNMTKENQKQHSCVAEQIDPTLEGRYANYFKVGHNAYEFFIDFGQYTAENEQAELYTRIITSPIYAKAFLNILLESIKQHECVFGSIEEI